MPFKVTTDIANEGFSRKSRNGFLTLLLGISSLLLVACGGGSGGSSTTFTVTAVAGANGSVSPATATVASGTTTTFSLTPDSGYTIDSVSGCSGSLSGNTYTTGTITTDCSVTISFRSRQFVWMGGSDTVAAGGNYGSLGVEAASNVPGARDTAVSWTDASGNLWLFGGVGYYAAGSAGRLNDLWKYDPTSGQWTWMSGSNTQGAVGDYGSLGVEAASNVPGARNNAASWTDANGNLWLFGGTNPNFAALNDLWKYDPTSGQWTWMSGSNTANAVGDYGSLGVAAASNIPGARQGASAWTDTNGNLWLFGGMDSSTNHYNDLWKYDPTSGQWTWISGSNTPGASANYGSLGVEAASNIPGARRDASTWIDASDNLWLFGGIDQNSGPSFFNDLWKYNLTSGQWTWMSGSNTANAVGDYGTLGTAAASNVPGARCGATSWTDASGKLWLFGGAGYDTSSLGDLNDLWQYDPDSGQWTWMSGSNTVEATGVYGTPGTPAASNVLGARYDSVSWVDAYGNPWIFGGWNDYTDLMNDLWSYK